MKSKESKHHPFCQWTYDMWSMPDNKRTDDWTCICEVLKAYDKFRHTKLKSKGEAK